MRVTLLCALFFGLLAMRVLGQQQNLGGRWFERARNRNFNNRNGALPREFLNNNNNNNNNNNQLAPTENVNAFPRNEGNWVGNPNTFVAVPNCLQPRHPCGPIQLVQRECCRGNCRGGFCPL